MVLNMHFSVFPSILKWLRKIVFTCIQIFKQNYKVCSNMNENHLYLPPWSTEICSLLFQQILLTVFWIITSKACGYAQGMLHGMNDKTSMTLMDVSFYFISNYSKFQLSSFFCSFNCDPAKLKTATKSLLAVKKCCSNCMLIYLIPRDTQAFHEVT